MGNELKATKGPWECDFAEHDEPYQKIRIRLADHKYRVISEVWQDDAPLVDYNEEQRANARLIAAAPELYRELEHFHSWACGEFATYEISEDGIRIASVLAKARGES